MQPLWTSTATATAALALALSPIGCRGDAPSDQPPETGNADDGNDDGNDDGVATAGDDTMLDDTAGGGSGFDDSAWEGTAFIGEVHAAVGFTFSAPHVLRANAVVGVVAGYRTAEASWDFEDLYSPVMYFLPFPDAPSGADSTSFDGLLPAFDLGSEADWLTAGNGLQLRPSDGGGFVSACLQDYIVSEVGESPSDPPVPRTYPVYLTGQAGQVNCQPLPAEWIPEAAYDVVLFGGELYADHELLARVTTPPALEVTAPDMTTLDAPIAAGDDLSFSWNGVEGDTRIVIRILDIDGNLVSAHATDDGDYTVASSDLAMLVPGPVDILVAREREDRMLFSEGGISVVSRHEQWGFFTLE